MAKRLKIAFDLDGVVYDMVTPLDRFMKLNKIKLANEDSYNLDERYGLSEGDGWKYMNKFAKLRPFNWMPLDERAKDEMLSLSRENDLYVVTYRNWARFGIEDTLERIRYDHLPINAKNIIFSKDKGDVARDIGIDLFYEDSAENAIDIITKSDSLVKLVDTTYNQDISHKRIQRIKW